MPVVQCFANCMWEKKCRCTAEQIDLDFIDASEDKAYMKCQMYVEKDENTNGGMV